MFLKNRNIIFKMKMSKVTDYAALNLEIKFLHVAVFVKIAFQHINYPYMLRIYRPNFMKFKVR